ncbi:glycoside hydrolase family 93 protein [Hortaea werneckii]|nr:glycoside hydrolase family 93 protein [Hortaea werneckii]KAI7350814.1 glycoside hydrolase family 93 protein [Hortaea werneckii]
MKLTQVSLLSSFSLLTAARPHHHHDYFNNVTIFTPPSEWEDRSTSYARTVLLNQDCEKEPYTLLATWTVGAPDGPYFPIYESQDYGRSWSERSKAYFTGGNFTGGTLLQPFLYETSKQFGKYPAGTVLLSGNGIPGNFNSTNIQLYASEDKGYSWEFVSTVNVGTRPNTTNGASPIWEPFINAYGDQLAVYYSDQGDPEHGQSQVFQTSTDLESWGTVTDAVAFANYTQRPGMITMAQIGDGKNIGSGKWITTFEVGLPDSSGGRVDTTVAPYAVSYKIADDPYSFQDAPTFLLQSTEGLTASAGPYVVWTPAGGENGTIVVSDSTTEDLFLNTQNGDPDAWVNVTSGHGVGYSRSLRVMPGNGGKTVLVTNGGMYGEDETIVTTGEFIVPGKPAWGHFDAFAECERKHHGWGGWW